MRIEELRITNLIKWRGHEHHVATFNRTTIGIITNEGLRDIPFDEIEGVQVTEENVKGLNIDRHGNKFKMSKGGETCVMKLGDSHYIFKYLHKAQNLLFFLMDEGL